MEGQEIQLLSASGKGTRMGTEKCQVLTALLVLKFLKISGEMAQQLEHILCGRGPQFRDFNLSVRIQPAPWPLGTYNEVYTPSPAHLHTLLIIKIFYKVNVTHAPFFLSSLGLLTGRAKCVLRKPETQPPIGCFFCYAIQD